MFTFLGFKFFDLSPHKTDDEFEFNMQAFYEFPVDFPIISPIESRSQPPSLKKVSLAIEGTTQPVITHQNGTSAQRRTFARPCHQSQRTLWLLPKLQSTHNHVQKEKIIYLPNERIFAQHVV